MTTTTTTVHTLEHVGFTLEIRSAEAAERLKSERLLTAIVAPYGETSMLTPHPKGERFARNAFRRTVDDIRAGRRKIKLFRSHGHLRGESPVGFAESWDVDDDRGLIAEFRIAETAAGDETLQEIELGLLDSMSLGFYALQARAVAGGVREVLQARILEASVLAIGAYDGATVLAVRDPADPVDPDLSARIAALTALPPAPRFDTGRPLIPWRT